MKRSWIVLRETHLSDKTPLERVEEIVSGNPRLDVASLGKQTVAIIEWAEGQEKEAVETFKRAVTLGGVGACFTYELDVALREFAVWVRHYAPGTVAGFGIYPVEEGS